MQIPEELDQMFQNGGLIHISGPAGSGKTMLCVALVTEIQKHGDVHWVAADSKIAFTAVLRDNISSVSGNPQRIIMKITSGHIEVQDAIRTTTSSITDETKMIIIDPITRSLDLSWDDDLMWGQPLFEELLPTLAAVSASRSIPIVITSEVRRFPNGEDIPIHWESIRKWSDIELRMTGRPILGPRTVEIHRNEKWVPFMDMSIDDTGLLKIQHNRMEATDCSESCPA